jgi:Ser/Thr protein kinase RdoA (MazF antagonist)
MEPIVNLEETPGKMVGRIKRRTPAEALGRLVARFHEMGLKLPYPKGVQRFKTHEEANAWEWNHMMAAAVKKFRDRLTSKT